MATPAAKGRMAALARNRVTEAGPALASLLGVEWPETLKSKDIDIQRIREQEALADFLEAAIDKLGFLGDGEMIEGQAFEFDVDGAYLAYLEDDRHGGEADADAFTAAVESMFALPLVESDPEGGDGEEPTDDPDNDATGSSESAPPPDESSDAAAKDETAATGSSEADPQTPEPDTAATPTEPKPVATPKTATKAKAK